MSKKRFDHFMNFWQQVLQARPVKPSPNRRAAKAKARLRMGLAASR